MLISCFEGVVEGDPDVVDSSLVCFQIRPYRNAVRNVLGFWTDFVDVTRELATDVGNLDTCCCTFLFFLCPFFHYWLIQYIII